MTCHASAAVSVEMADFAVPLFGPGQAVRKSKCLPQVMFYQGST